MIGALFDRLRDRRHRVTMNRDAATGRRGEDLAHRYLQRRGYTIVARNYRLPSGDAEADIIARDGEDLAIVEVKTRETADYGPPDRAIGPEKLRHMTRVARDWGLKTKIPPDRIRLDVVTVILSRPPKIELYRGVMQMNG